MQIPAVSPVQMTMVVLVVLVSGYTINLVASFDPVKHAA
jgi:hypothetical protein